VRRHRNDWNGMVTEARFCSEYSCLDVIEMLTYAGVASQSAREANFKTLRRAFRLGLHTSPARSVFPTKPTPGKPPTRI